ncbi:MAG: molybdopterin-dependent oxidoreductase [Candidatus Hodarchaeales archaeon]
MKPRLPPGQHLAKKMAVFSLESVPFFDGEQWDLEITGNVENPVTISWKEFNELEQAQLTADFHCVTSWSLFDTVWEGVLFKTIIDLVKPLPSAKFVLVKARSQYTTNLRIDDVLAPDAILATKFKGRVIDPKHGAPIRLVVPQKYAYKACKWVAEIEFLEKETLGYWEQRGYSNSADPWKEQRFIEDD